MSVGPIPDHDCSIPQERTDEHFIERHATFLRRRGEGPIDLLFLGDSITRRWAEVPDLWSRYFGRYQAANFGIGSDTTQSVLWRLQNGELEGVVPRLVVLLIGTNNVPTNTGVEVGTAVRKIVDTLQISLPAATILLMAIFPRGPQAAERAADTDPWYMDRVIEANSKLSELQGRPRVRYLDIGSAFLQPDGEIDPALMPDRLHLVRPGFVVWGDSIKPAVSELMKTEL